MSVLHLHETSRFWPDRTVAVLNKGGTVITVDDGCYVIKNKTSKGWGRSAWIFVEALEVLKTLPANPREAQDI